MKGIDLHLGKNGSDGILFWFVTTRTNPFSSYSLTLSKGGM